MNDVKITNIINSIKDLSVGELLKLNESLKEVFNISSEMLSAGMGSGSANTGEAEAPVVDVNKKVSIVLKDLGKCASIQYIKIVKDLFGASIAAAKTQAEEAAAGKLPVIKSDITMKEAQEILEQIKKLSSDLVLEIK